MKNFPNCLENFPSCLESIQRIVIAWSRVRIPPEADGSRSSAVEHEKNAFRPITRIFLILNRVAWRSFNMGSVCRWFKSNFPREYGGIAQSAEQCCKKSFFASLLDSPFGPRCWKSIQRFLLVQIQPVSRRWRRYGKMLSG